MRRLFLIVACIGILALLLAACGEASPTTAAGTPTNTPAQTTTPPPAKPIEWKMDTWQPIGHPNVLEFEKFAQEVTERTGGRLQITVHPGSSLGYPGAQVARPVRDGFVEMADAAYVILAGDLPVAAVNNLPFFATTYDEARKVDLATRDLLGKEWQERFKSRILFSYTWPAQHLFANFPAPTVKDWSGKKIRGYSPETSDLTKLAGGTPVTMPLTELYTALSRGVVDGYITGSINIKPYKFNEVTKYANIGSFAVVGPSHVIVNSAAFDALPEDIKAIVNEVAQEIEAEHWQLIEDKDAEWLAELPGLGMELVQIQPAEVAKLEELAKPLWDAWAQKYAPVGAQVLETARNAIGK